MFGAQCGFCHGRDAMGGAGGPDLTRSLLVAEDVRGDASRPSSAPAGGDKGMPAFSLSETELAAVVAFIHDQKAKADGANGDRRTVDAADLQTGNAEAGKRYFEASVRPLPFADWRFRRTGDTLSRDSRCLQRMLYPGRCRRPRGHAARVPQTVTVTLPSGQVIDGRLAYRDEFTIALTDATGWYRSWPTGQVKFVGERSAPGARRAAGEVHR